MWRSLLTRERKLRPIKHLIVNAGEPSRAPIFEDSTGLGGKDRPFAGGIVFRRVGTYGYLLHTVARLAYRLPSVLGMTDAAHAINITAAENPRAQRIERPITKLRGRSKEKSIPPAGRKLP